jgi:hypothetical protein
LLDTQATHRRHEALHPGKPYKLLAHLRPGIFEIAAALFALPRIGVITHDRAHTVRYTLEGIGLGSPQVNVPCLETPRIGPQGAEPGLACQPPTNGRVDVAAISERYRHIYVAYIPFAALYSAGKPQSHSIE